MFNASNATQSNATNDSSVTSPSPSISNYTVPSPSSVTSPSPSVSNYTVPSPSVSNYTVPSPSSVTSPSPSVSNYTVPSPSSVTSPSPSVSNYTVPSPSSVTSPSPSVSNYTVPSPSSFVPSPTIAPFSPTPFDDHTTTSSVPSAEEVALQQFLLALAASLLCLFLMFRNKERIMKRTFQSRSYINIEPGDDSEHLVELSVMPQIDDIHYMGEKTDDERSENEV
jgi:hypothetical protein